MNQPCVHGMGDTGCEGFDLMELKNAARLKIFYVLKSYEKKKIVGEGCKKS